MIELTDAQQRAYNRYINARNKVGLVRTQGFTKRQWVRFADVTCTVDIEGFNHPFFEFNEDWDEYKKAFEAWLAVEPESRKTERMSAIKGDYGTSDNWDESTPNVRDTYSVFNGGE